MASAALKPSDFARSSRLASGKWVKVAVSRDGIYEVSYETLRNMGFSDPTKVGVYGRGGHMISGEFSSATGKVEYQDDLPQVPIFRMNDKIYFYGVGTLQLGFERNLLKYDGGGIFSRTDNNLYSTEGYYFLSDSDAPLLMQKVAATVPTKTVKECNIGVGVLAHEVDLIHNQHDSGQLYFGEKMTPADPRLRFELSMPDAIPGAKGAVQCVYYTDKEKELTGSYGFENTDQIVETRDILYATGDYTPHSPTISELNIPGQKATFFTEINFDAVEGRSLDVSNLDHWVVSYARNIPTLRDADGNDLAQDLIALPSIYYPNVGKIKVPDALNRVVFDVSDPAKPRYLELKPDGKDGILYLSPGLTPPMLVFMNPTKTQLEVRLSTLSESDILNQDLHAEAAEGADLIIVCIPQLKEAAERLARLHREHMDQRVIVATTQECYNEFSNGMPDPQAIRSLVKMAHVSEYGCRNLLLMGPLFSDFRGITSDKNPMEGIIAYQSLSTNSERGGFNANDFYGIMTEHIGSSSIEELPVAVGVGILPIRYVAEAETYLQKVEKYITRTDFAYYLNHLVSFGGVGDADLHSAQVPEIDRHITSLGDRSLINSQVIVDTYGYQEAHDLLFRHAERGALLFTYFGHGNTCLLNLAGNFFRASDVYSFRNDFHPFWGFAGCELTVPDKGVRGMGESVVVGTPYGMIGTLLATRDTWSSMNLDLFKKFFNNFLRDGGTSSSPFYKDAMTIGEIYARTKTQSRYSNEMAYQLVCDPAIVIPQVNRKIILDEPETNGKAGEWLEINGYVAGYSTTDIDPEYNGEVVVRLMEPMRQLPCQHVIARNDPKVGYPDRDVMITYADSQVAMGTAKVTDGKFSLKIMLPSYIGDFEGSEGRLHLAAYDPATRLGAATMGYVMFEKANEGSSTLEADNSAPRIERFDYQAENSSITITVSDDIALAFDDNPFSAPFRLFLDGREFRTGASKMPVLNSEAMAYTKVIDLPDLQYGSHTAKVTVKDVAGNEASAELVFDHTAPLEKFTLTLPEGVVDGSGRFLVEGTLPNDAEIIILNADGLLVHRARIDSSEYIWDATTQDGSRVNPGLYKAYLIETGASTSKGHSPLINVPVI